MATLVVAPSNTKEYKRNYMRTWAAKNRGRLNEYNRARNAQPARKAYQSKQNAMRRAKTRAIVDKIKLEKGCVDCGYNINPVALDFDHVYGKKVSPIGVMVSNRVSIEKILVEIEKCEVRCANCHRIKSFRKP